MTTTAPQPPPTSDKPAPPPAPPPKKGPPMAAGGAKTAPPPPAAETRPPKSFVVERAPSNLGQRVVLYGTGGVGKTTLASLAPDPVFIDLDQGAGELDIDVVRGVETWADLRDALASESVVGSRQTIVIDSLTAAQGLAIAYTVEHVKHEKGYAVTSIEGYGFGKGFQYVYDTLLPLLGDLDGLTQRGKHVILVCHCVTAHVANPEGEDYDRHEPDLLQPPRNGRFRDRVKNWCDHLLFVAFDMAFEDGKAIGSGTRSIRCTEMPPFWAKSRKLRETIPCVEGSKDLWHQLLGDDNAKSV